MPSYRSILTVTTLRPGRNPAEVEAEARRARRLESFDVSIAAGEARATLRFTALDDEEAREAHALLRAAVETVAEVPGARLAKVVRGRSEIIGA